MCAGEAPQTEPWSSEEGSVSARRGAIFGRGRGEGAQPYGSRRSARASGGRSLDYVKM